MVKTLRNIVVCLILTATLQARAQHDTCRVALMVPLYLEQVDRAFYDAEPSNKTLQTKPFSFLHFYEGLMIAADSMTNSRGMILDLKVYDVDNDVKKADTAIADPWLETADLIIGPFYLKAFEVVKEFACWHDIAIVNPITPRSNIVDSCCNVIKVKPSAEGQLAPLDSIVKHFYHDNSIFIVKENWKVDSEIISKINEIAERNIDSCTLVPNKHIIDVIRKHHKRWNYMKLTYDEADYRTDSISLDINVLKKSKDDSTLLINRIVNINYEYDSLRFVPDFASTLRNNLFIVYGNDKVFANEIVNKVTKLTENYPVTVIMMPDWSKFGGLFNDNLMRMKAICFDGNYIDYGDIKVESFVCKFRTRYNTEPTDYAFDGFDIGWYFLNALDLYGKEMIDNLPGFKIPLLHTDFDFQRKDDNSGLENNFWHVYQFKGYNKVILKTDDER